MLLCQVILLGDRVPAEEAHAWGIVQYFVPEPGSPITVALETAGKLLKRSATATMIAKHTIDRSSSEASADGSLYRERIGEGALYQLKFIPSTVITGAATQNSSSLSNRSANIKSTISQALRSSGIDGSRASGSVGHVVVLLQASCTEDEWRSILHEMGFGAATLSFLEGSIHTACQRTSIWCGHPSNHDKFAVVVSVAGAGNGSALVFSCPSHKTHLGHLPLGNGEAPRRVVTIGTQTTIRRPLQRGEQHKSCTL